MPRIIGVDIPDHKKVKFALRSIYGIGPKKSADIVKQAKINSKKRARDLTSEEINRIQKILENYQVEGDLRRNISDNINRLKRIQTYRGERHRVNLPCRGQRTRSNSRTVRGRKRQTIGAVSKEMAAKIEAGKKKKK
jgi:small subunit ribosomal protein S13